MLRQAICTSFRRVNRVALNNSRQWGPSFRTRKYTVSPSETIGALEKPQKNTSALQAKRKVSKRPRKPPVPKPRTQLPAPPEASTAPLVESDFLQYLVPLYAHGWQFVVINFKGQSYGALRRDFELPSTTKLIAFTENTRNMSSGNIAVLRGLSDCIVQLSSLDGVTRSMIRLAMEYQAEYKNIVGPDYPVPKVSPFFKIKSLEKAVAHLGRAKSHQPGVRKPFTPVVSVSLPSPPPTPVLNPPPSITEADVKTYIQPLVSNGWTVAGPPRSEALAGFPSLHRIYFFHDYPSARLFFNAIVAAIPVPTPDSLAGVEVRLRGLESSPVIEMWSISELADGAPKKYGISHADVRFSIAVENEFAANWAGRADNLASSTPQLLNTIGDVWNYGRAKRAKSPVDDQAPGKLKLNSRPILSAFNMTARGRW
ncbi:hypothetical protein DFH09DRAFT_1134132 [Mycena vulgaris]|nr:hypothetical protein DFH09DRAFT_1134132 [Mycena vulgaris]